MSYSVLLHPKANAFLGSVESDLIGRIRGKLLELASNPRKGTRLRHSDFWRLRIGDYRATYEIDNERMQVVVLFIGHGKDVYDDFSRLL